MSNFQAQFKRAESVIQKEKRLYDVAYTLHISRHDIPERIRTYFRPISLEQIPRRLPQKEYGMLNRLYQLTVVARLRIPLRIIINVYKFHDLHFPEAPLSSIERKELLLRADVLKKECVATVNGRNEDIVSLSEVLLDDDGMGVRGINVSPIEDLLSRLREFRGIVMVEKFKLDVNVLTCGEAFEEDLVVDIGTTLKTFEELSSIWQQLGLPRNTFWSESTSEMPLANLFAAIDYHAVLKDWDWYTAFYSEMSDGNLRKVPAEVVKSFRHARPDHKLNHGDDNRYITEIQRRHKQEYSLEEDVRVPLRRKWVEYVDIDEQLLARERERLTEMPELNSYIVKTQSSGSALENGHVGESGITSVKSNTASDEVGASSSHSICSGRGGTDGSQMPV
ncbi:hypothetical protein SeLEV6574_g06394 [Synchytrium endobioticum]|uniref:Uncharacterized protein n=1 Tax=Synchytrium endobioticum TaxID=286115 RepID=A0A507CNV0_9FUNG|nr:hypothetical protein SeLEV6574_g06394 [Synchytrium endobioticum]